MKISVIIPSYKPSEYIWTCLDSLCMQTLDNGLYEILIILNGCNEPYYSKLNEYIYAHVSHTIRLLQTDEPGVSNARNIGIESAKGDYITFVDDDDWVTKDYLASMLAKSGEGIVVATNVKLYNEADGCIMDYFLTRSYARNANVNSITFFSARSFLSNVCEKLIPRQVIGDNRLDLAYRLGEDSLFMFQLSNRIKELRFTGADTIYMVRLRGDSVSHSMYPYSYRAKLAFRLTYSYFCIYIRDVRHYNFWLFVSRIVATLRKLFYRKYE